MREAKKEPQKLEDLRKRESKKIQKQKAIENAVSERLANNMAIYRAEQVQTAVKHKSGLEVSLEQVRKTMRKELHMGYRQASTIPVQANSERCLVLRQQYALKMLPMLEKSNSHRIINVDESWLNQTRFVRRLWVPTDAAGSICDKQVQPRISLIIALDTEGKMWCALTQANTDADVMKLFLRYMERQLDLETPGWQENSTILLDNAAWHTNPLIKARLARM